MEYTTESGLVVRDRRHDRSGEIMGEGALGGPMWPTPLGGYAPGQPFPASPWAGWPDDWGTPPMNPAYGDWSGEGYGRMPMFGRVSTAFTCIDLVSRTLGSFPVYGVTGDRPHDLPTWSDSPEPALWESWPIFMQAAVASILLRGECITYVTARNPDDGSIARFTLLNPDMVEIELLDGRVVTKLGAIELPPEDVLVVRYQAIPNRLRGISPLEWAAGPLVTASALESYSTKVASRGGIPWAVLKTNRSINAEQAAEAQSRWVAASSRRDGAPAVLGNDWDISPVTFSPKDMALLDMAEFSQRAICAAFGVPGFLVSVPIANGMTYNNAESVFFQFWTSTLRPLANLFATAWSRWLLPRGTRMEYNPDRFTQPPFAQRVTSYQTLFGLYDPATGQRAMSIDEIRAAERLPPDPNTTPTPVAGTQTLTGAST